MSPAPPRWSRYATALAALLAATLAVPAGGPALAADPEARAPRVAADIPAADYQQVQLALGAAELGEAMSLAVLPDRSVLHTARDGTVRLTDAAGATKTAGKLAVYAHDEEGLQGIAVDPGFSIDCSKVKVTYLLGHDSHRHQITSKNGCSGTIDVPVDGEHDTAANIYGVFDAEYTDAGGLTTRSDSVLQPRHRQGEHFAAHNGVQVAPHGPAEGGATVGYTDNGDWLSFTPYVLSNATSITARVASGGAGGTLEVRAGSATGTLLSSLTVAPTGGWENFVNVTADVHNAPSGPTELFFVFKGPAGQGSLFDLDAFTFDTQGAQVDHR
ncbi:carbohydrate-binding protein [Streptomyces sp. DH18]|uniref:carbohydrate-binding protein n=1 Tax=Streptomyces sp. DH18 TaxID=3040126 RepID=UPI0024414D15|nr:carbohydrate-binding protein [Streptomyces sp. DH18]MDG9683027.1 carbohydrate-binding protein [Streptomyces sp. DH18]